MDLESDQRQNIQSELDFSPRGEARKVGRQEVESAPAMGEPESPANTCRIMEEVCERDNLREAFQRVKSNKGSAGIDGMTIDDLSAYPERALASDSGATTERDLGADAYFRSLGASILVWYMLAQLLE